MEQQTENDGMQQDNAYEYTKFPENIRQVGESGGVCRIYIEDYVMTYMRRIFREKQENAMLVLVGTYGKGVVSGCPFVYGAVLFEADVLEGVAALSKDKWDDVYRQIHEYFSGAQILGWAFGVNLWNSHTDNVIRQIQKKFFGDEGKILFLSDLSEKEEKVFFWKNGEFKEQSGYVIYFEKNGQMQDYMLGTQEGESFEADYTDKVTDEIRNVIDRKEEWRKNRQQYIFGGFVAVVVFVLVLGGNILLGSLSKIENLEQSIEAMKRGINNESPQGGDDGIAVSKLTGNKEVTSEKNAKNQSSKNEKNSGKVTPTASQESKVTPSDKAAAITASPKASSTNTVAPTVSSTAIPTAKVSETEKPSASETAAPKISMKKKDNEVVALGRKYDSYIVQKGDTLSQIVWKQYHSFVHLKAIKKVNKIKNADEIYQGQCLILPRFED